MCEDERDGERKGFSFVWEWGFGWDWVYEIAEGLRCLLACGVAGGTCAVLLLKGYGGGAKAIAGIILLGLFQTAGFLGFTFWALVERGAGKTAVLVYTMPFWVLILARLFLGERIRGGQWPAVILSFAGLLMIFEPWHSRGGLLSEMLAVMAGIFWAPPSSSQNS